MATNTQNGRAGRRMGRRGATTLLAASGVAALALIASACGSGSNSPGVAQVGTTTTSTRSSSSSSGSGKGDPAAFSACMRKNGVPDFPDPDSNGNLRITGGQTRGGQKFGLDPDSPQFKKAQQACRKLQPNGGKPDPQEEARMKEQALKFSQCMRSHGVPKFPDPEFRAGGGTLMKIGKDVNPNSPQFKAAAKACQKLVPGGPLPGPPPGKP